MASLNQFKLVNQKCLKYYEIMENSLGNPIDYKKDSNKYRFGFYLYVLECLTNIKDTNELIDKITDTDFNKIIFGDANDDCGIDAIYIDDENRNINLFNFKYREQFNEFKQQSQNTVFTSSKFTSAIKNSSTEHLNGKIKQFAKEIIEKLESNDIWKMKLYMVSNESVGLEPHDTHIDQLKSVYDLEVESISLNEISNFISNRPDSINAKLVLEKDAILSYTESFLVSAKSYIVKLSLIELIRITCNDNSFRETYNLEDISPLIDKDIDYGVLFDNVRGFLGDTKYNKNILKTLKEQPTKFFMFNNGLTITADNIEAEEINGKRKLLIGIENFQVVNGGQTLRTIHEFKKLNHDNIDHLCESDILVRIFKTGSTSVNNKIAEFTNSQNAISIIDLKSLSTEQRQIEQILDDNNIIYARKIGDTGLNPTKVYTHKISMEKLAQILFSIHGNPEKATAQKKKIFEKYYDQTFGEENFDINKSADIVKQYYEIKNIYENIPTYDSSDQKIYYIMYLQKNTNKSIEENIDTLEQAISEYREGDNISSSRKLIQKGFKEFLDRKCEINKQLSFMDMLL